MSTFDRPHRGDILEFWRLSDLNERRDKSVVWRAVYLGDGRARLFRAFRMNRDDGVFTPFNLSAYRPSRRHLGRTFWRA